jgi:putative transposase
MQTAEQIAVQVGVVPACRALGVGRATLYRYRRPAATASTGPRQPALRTLSLAQRQTVLDVLHSERFVDASPSQVYATLLDEGQYLCSERTMSGCSRSTVR